MKKLAVILVMMGCLNWAFGQLPEPYRHVDSIDWVVSDLDQVVQGWNKLGFQETQELGEVTLPGLDYRGKTSDATLRVAAGYLGSVLVIWMQPLQGENAFSDFLARHGDGVFSLNHSFPSQEALDKEIARLNGLGIKVLQRGAVDTAGGTMTFAYMDTEPQGKYVLGLVHDPNYYPGPSDSLPFDMKNSQYAFIVKDLRSVSKFWTRIGIPPMSYTHPTLSDLMYHGKPGHFDQELGWQKHGDIEYEWITPLKGPTVYQDSMDKHGEGFHHLAFAVNDIDAVTKKWAELGFPTVQSGSWGEKGKPGYGRYAYADTDSIGGVIIEFLWNFKEK